MIEPASVPRGAAPPRDPGGPETASTFAPVRGSLQTRRAASRRLIPSTYTARRTCPYSSTPFIPPPSAYPGRRPFCCRTFARAVPRSVALEKLHGALVLLSGRSRRKSAKIAPLARLRILLLRPQ